MNELELSKYYLNLTENDFVVFDIEKLSKLLEYHSDLYYNKESPIISDYEYDILFKKLQFLEEKFSIKESQTLKVWSEVSESIFTKVAHSRPMISLDNTYNEEDLKDFDERIKRVLWIHSPLTPLPKGEGNINISYIIEFKFDWLWVELIYNDWKLIQAITRWNWIQWEDVTQNVKTIKNIPKTILYKEHLEIRWEVVMPISSFEKLNKNALENWWKVFSNPRNAASWSLRLLDSSITAERNLKFFAYDVSSYLTSFLKETEISRTSPSEELQVMRTYYNLINSLKDLWFEISSYFKKCQNILEVISSINNFWDIKKTIDFDIDGLVIKMNDLNLWQDVWFTAHHPRYAIAYKFPSCILTTKILSVEHQVWRTGTITPVANLEPINISWVIVKRATLHNYDEIKKLWIHIWDNIFIKRAWEVIPKIIWVSYPSPLTPLPEVEGNIYKQILTPEFCPSCRTKLEKDNDKVRIYCPNHYGCKEQIKQKIINSVWKSWFNIDWLWSEQVELFLKKGLILDLADIFNLENKKDQILILPWYKEKSVQNLLMSIEKSKKQNIVNFLIALNIFGIWKQWAKELSKIINSNEEILNFNFSIEELSNLQDIWEETAKNIYNFFNDYNNNILLKKLLNFIEVEYKKEIISWKYVWKKMCITWSFLWYSREELIKILESKWWNFVWSISKNTDFLLAWEKAWSKFDKAQKLWIKIIDLDEFLKF